MATRPLSRRITFYGWKDVWNRTPFDRLGAAQAVSQLDAADWALDDGGDFTSAVLIDEAGTRRSPTFLRLFRLRSGDETPHKLNAQRVATPVDLEADEAITDWTHVVIWPDNYAAHDSRRDAPGMGRLSIYLREMVSEHVRFFPLYDRTLIDQLRELDDIKSVEVKLQMSKAEHMADLRDRGLFGGILGIGEATDAVTVSTKVSVGQSRKHFLSGIVRGEVIDIAAQAEELLDHLTVNGVRDGQPVHIDLLRSKLTYALSVARSRALTNAPDPDAMYQAIIDARGSLTKIGVLQRAVRVK